MTRPPSRDRAPRPAGPNPTKRRKSTPELPLHDPDAPPSRPAPRRRARPEAAETPERASRPAPAPVQPDLFAPPEPVPARRSARRPKRPADIPPAAPAPEPPQATDASPPARRRRRSPQPEAAPAFLPAEAPAPSPVAPEPAAPAEASVAAAMIGTADPAKIRATDRPDGYLYHVTTGAEARALMDSGLLPNAADPLILTERAGVPHWLGVLTEDVDVILDGPPDTVVLRVRRQAVEPFLEPDPNGPREARRASYLLTGGPAGRG